MLIMRAGAKASWINILQISKNCFVRRIWMSIVLIVAGGLFAGARAAQNRHGFWKRMFDHRSVDKLHDQKHSLRKDKKSQLTRLSLAQLGNVVVTTVSEQPEKVWRTPAAIYVITQEDIKRSGATTIPEALRLAPGVEVSRIDADHWAVGIRGFGSQFSRSLLVLVDGRSVYTPLFAGVYWDVQNVMLQDVERIEVIRGPGGTIWGSNAVNGVINIITKNSRDTHGALLSAGGGNVDQGMTALRYGAGNGNGLNYRVYGMGFTRGPEYHNDGLNYDDWRMGQAGFRLDWDAGPDDSLRIQGDAYDGENGNRVAYAAYSPPAQVNISGYADVSGGNILGDWHHRFNDKADIQVRGYFDHTSRHEPDYGEVRNTFDFDFLNHLELWHHQNFLWGFGARWSSGDFLQKVPTVTFIPNNRAFNLYSGFVQDEIPIIGDKLSLTVGSKFEHNSYTGLEVEPTARLLWAPEDHETFWAAVTRAVRTPSRIDRDLLLTGFLRPAPPLPIYVQVTGNPNFTSERLTSYDVGYRQLISPRLYVDVVAFRNAYSGLSSYGHGSVFINQIPPSIFISFPFVNGLKGYTDGIEIAPDWRPTSWWRLTGSYSFLHINLENKPGNLDKSTLMTDQGSSPKHQFAIRSYLDLPGNVELDETYRYMSALPAQGVAAYGTADAHFGWQPISHLEFSLNGENLLQPSHVEYTPGAGPQVGIKRSVFSEITVRW